jgi:hypothetical protein
MYTILSFKGFIWNWNATWVLFTFTIDNYDCGLGYIIYIFINIKSAKLKSYIYF